MLNYERLQYLLDPHDCEEYSGRGMYGRKCLSVTTQDGQSVFSLLADIIADCEEVGEASELLSKARTDSMGINTVIYWPNIKIPA